jgi:hypothetical protein
LASKKGKTKMKYTYDETRPATLLADWHDKYRLPSRTYDDAKSMCYLRVSEVQNGERVSRWKLGSITEWGTDALMETFREAMSMVRADVENGIDREDVTEVLGLLIISHGEGRWGTEHPETGEPCLFDQLPEDQQRSIIEQASTEELIALRAGSVPVRVVNIISLSGLLGEVTMFPPGGEPTVEINEQWTGEVGDDNVRACGAIDEILIKTMTLLSLLSEVAREGHDLTPAGLMDYSMNLLRRGDESANEVMSLVLKMIAFALDNDEVDLTGGNDDDD